MEQVIFAGYNDSLPHEVTEYNSLQSGLLWWASEVEVRQIVSTGGKIKNLRVKVTAGPGVGKSWTFTLMLNGVATALTVTIADADPLSPASGADMTHEVSVSAGDTVSLRCVPSGVYPTIGAFARWTTMFVGSVSKESLILGGITYETLSNTATEYAQAMGEAWSPGSTENDYRQVCPTPGKIKNLYVALNVDPGTSPDAYRFTLRVNGADSALTVTITADDITGNDTAHEVTVAAGDVLTMKIEPLNGPSATPYAYWGMTFVADTDGESIVIAGADNALDTGVTEYNYLAGSWTSWSATEDQHSLGQLCTLKKLYVLLSAAPGAGKSYAFTVRINGAGGNLTVTISDAATTGNDVAHTDAISNDDYLGLECAPASTPALADAYWGVVGYIPPTAYKDIPTRFKLGARSYKDVATRFKIAIGSYEDTATRFDLHLGYYKDIAARFLLQVQSYTDIAARFRLTVQAFRDIATRFNLIVQSFKDTATRFILAVAGYTDTTTRFRLILQPFVDVGTRFRLLPVAQHKDVSTRFFLYEPSWKSLQILKEIAELEATVAGLERKPRAHFEI